MPPIVSINSQLSLYIHIFAYYYYSLIRAKTRTSRHVYHVLTVA